VSKQASSTPTLEAIRYRRGTLELLDQLRLPHEFVYDTVQTSEAAWEAIRSMKVRGAPAIAIAAVLSLAAEAEQKRESFESLEQAYQFLCDRLDYLQTSRPTAVNLFEATGRLKAYVTAEFRVATAGKKGARDLLRHYIVEAEKMLAADIKGNRAIGQFGAQTLLSLSSKEHLQVLTHCNTGSLATAGYGTALGVVRALHESGQLKHCFATETRPYNQGARLTAFELVFERIPGTLITDSMASFLMATKGIDAVVVGADRIVANGDTANKIGTYQLAIAAKYHGIPFLVAAPVSSIDLTLEEGAQIHIEERPPDELTNVSGIRIAALGIGVWNPSFDITPAALISGIVTEFGTLVDKKPDGTFDVKKFLQSAKADQ
jgi:methylthioribose-1-phosphate isomerase